MSSCEIVGKTFLCVSVHVIVFFFLEGVVRVELYRMPYFCLMWIEVFSRLIWGHSGLRECFELVLIGV